MDNIKRENREAAGRIQETRQEARLCWSLLSKLMRSSLG
jgi:hypothetical protein